MSKILKVAALVVGVVAITVATAGIGAAPAIAASGTGFGAVAASSAVGASLFGLSVGTLTGIGAGLSVSSSLLAKKPGAGSAVGSPTNWKSDVAAPLPYWIGRTKNAGSIVARMGYRGTTNTDQTFVTVYSAAGPIAGFDQFLVDGIPTTFTASGSSSGVANSANGSLYKFAWLNSQVGNQPETVAFVPPNAAMPGWSSGSKLSGLAATMFTVYFDEKGKVFPSGLPKLETVGRGVRVYDPRADSTYPGGSGTQRAANEATWAYSDNPWLHALTWAIGRRSNGIRTVGVGMPVASIDVDAFVQAANVADANGWKIGGVVGSTDDKWNVLKQMCQAGGGEPVRQAAMLSCFVNTPKVSLATITADDLADGDISFPAMQPRRARINSIVPTYRSEDHDWEVVAGTAVSGATYITEDGETRTRQVDYPLVQCFAGQQPVQAAQLAAYDIVNAREYGPIPLPLKPAWIRFKNGDCLTLNIPDANLVNQTAIILKRGLDPSNGSVSLTFRSETPAKHAFALGKTTTAPPTPSITAPPANPYWSDPNATRNDDGENLIIDPQFSKDLTYWPVPAGGYTIQRIAGFPIAAWVTNSSTGYKQAFANSNVLTEFNGVRTVYLVAYGYHSGSAVGTSRAVVDYYNASGTYVGGDYIDLFAGPADQFNRVVSPPFTPPATATKFLAYFDSNLSAGFVNQGGMRVARTQDAADVTQLVSPASAISTVNRDSSGGVLSGELPRDIGFKLLAGGVDITGVAAWSITSKPGYPTASATVSAGNVNVTAAAKDAVLVVSAVYNGRSSTAEITFPSSSAFPASSSATSTIAQTSSTTYGSPNTSILTVQAGPTGAVNLTFSGEFARVPVGTNSAWGKWQWRVPGGTFADVTTESASGQNTTRTAAVGTEPASLIKGVLGVSASKTGLTVGAPYEFQLLLRASTASTNVWSGTASGTAA